MAIMEKLDYFYGNQADQFVFYRVPKALFTEKRYHGLSAEAKLLYGLMLDRMGISVRNQWMDQEGRVYIYFTMDHAMELMDIGHNKAVKLFQDLEKAGLILRKKQGQGKPAMVYVMNFIPPQDPEREPDQAAPSVPPMPSDGQGQSEETDHQEEDSDSSKEETSATEQDRNPRAVQTSDNRKSEPEAVPEPEEPVEDTPLAVTPPTAESVELRPASNMEASRTALDFPPVLRPEVQTSEKRRSAFLLFGSQDIPKSEANKNNISNIKFSDTESSIYPPAPAPTGRQTARRKNAERMRKMEECRERIRDNIDYDLLTMDHPMDVEQIDGYVELMAEVMASDRASWRINQADIPAEQAAERFGTLNREHILYVKECLDNNTTHIGNMRAYTLTALYNAPTTMHQYYASKVSHDMAQEDWNREQREEEQRQAACLRRYVREFQESWSANA